MAASASVTPATGARPTRTACSPSAEPVSGSTACSGCGISPTTLPASLRHAGDVARRAVEVLPARVAQHDLAVRLELVEHRVGRLVAAGRVLGGDRERARRARTRASTACAALTTSSADLAADEAQRRVRQQRARAAGPPRTAPGSRCRCRAPSPPSRAKRSTSSITGAKRAIAPDAQVVAVGEAAGDDDRVDARAGRGRRATAARRRRRGAPRAARRPRRRSRGSGRRRTSRRASGLDLVVLDQRVRRAAARTSPASRDGVLDVELDQPADVHVATRPRSPSAGSARSTAWPCGSRIPAFGPDQDARPHGAARSSQASNGSPASRS